MTAIDQGMSAYLERKANRLEATRKAMKAHADRQQEPKEIAKKHARSLALARRMKWK
jgi:hypothetical protein